MTDNPRAEAIVRMVHELRGLRAMPGGTVEQYRFYAERMAGALGDLLPRLVSSEAELDALPMHSIVRIGNYAYQALGNGWFNSPADPTYSEAMLDMAEDEPVFVLWTPTSNGGEHQ